MKRAFFKTLITFVLILLVLVVVVAAAPSTIIAAPLAVTTNYAADNSTFPNPERGFHNRYDLVPGGNTDFSRSVSSGNTLVHSYVRLDSYRSSAIPQSVLTQLSNSLAAARSQGMKVILRVSYNFGPYPNSEPDATEYWIGQHLAQLRPVLEANQDVLAFLEAGFIGAWGEWHTSTNGLDTDMAAKIRILNNILANVPSSRQVALRYPSDVRAVINGGVSSARVGNHQDCFLASDPDDWGTWGRDPAYSVQQDKDFIASVGVNHPVGGETCNVSSPRANCSTALTEMQMMHFSELNEDYEPGVIGVFKSQGCYETIKQKMGYRFRLLNATYPTSASAGSSFNLQVSLTNDGWASPYNARPVFAVLDGSGGTYTFALSADPRNWEAGQQAAINQSFTLPSMPSGTYRLSLWLPDNATNLRSDARYSIRFANQNTWDAAKGYNILATNVQVGGGSGPTSTPPPGGALPSPWQHGDVGAVGQAGSASYSSGTFTVDGGGADIWGSADEFHYVYQTLTGDGQIVARVASLENTDAWAKAGVMMRETLSANSRHALMALTAGNGLAFQRRVSTGGESSHTSGGAGSAPYWVRLVRSGNTFTGYRSTDGTTWTQVGSASLSLGSTVYVGLAVTAHNDSTLSTATFSNVSVSGGGGPTATPPTVTPPTATPTRTPTPGGSSLLLDNFDGSPSWPGMNDLGKWAGANSFVNGSGVLSSGALVLQYNNTGWFGSDVLQDVSSKTYLVFVIKGSAGGEQNAFHVILGGVDKTFAAFSGDTITTSYKTIRINMSANGVNRSSPGQLQMTFWWGSSGTITIDEIRFE